MSFNTTLKSQLETSMSAIGTALSSGKATVRVKYGSVDIVAVPSHELLDKLYTLYTKVCKNVSYESRRMFTPASLQRVSRRGSS